MGMPEGEETTGEIFQTTMTENFPQTNVRHQTTEPGSSENINVKIQDVKRGGGGV